MTRTLRRQRILELISDREIASQQDLLDLLASEGVSTTQATLSRDLQALGVAKTPVGYTLPDAIGAPAGDGRRLEAALQRELVGIDLGGGLLVLRTRPGMASALALAIDRRRLPAVVGTVAGDDAIFVAVESASAARNLRAEFETMAGHA